MLSSLIATLACAFVANAAPLRAVATTPDIAWLLTRIGGTAVEVKTLARSSDNYHFLDARPDYVLAVARADVVCRVGADLEIGWLPKVLDRAANRKVMKDGSGDCDLSRAVSLAEKPTGPLDRAMGDVHGAGNPHFWLSPLEMAKAAREVEGRLVATAPERAGEFAANRQALENELLSLHETQRKRLAPLQGKGAYQYHRDFSYFLAAYGLQSMGSIEEVPGVSPSAARLGRVSLEAKNKNAFLALASTHDSRPTLEKFRELSGVKVVFLPTSLSDPQNPLAYRQWQESLVDSILQAAP